MAVHRRRPPNLGDQGADVFDLALDGVRGGVATIAPAIVVEDSEMLRQFLGGRAHQSPVAHRSTHHDDRRTIAQPVEGDGVPSLDVTLCMVSLSSLARKHRRLQ
jgi:hypothetical protein